MQRRAPSISALSLTALLLACSHTEPRGPSAESSRQTTERAREDREPRASGDETAEPPAPDPATLANGRALVATGPGGFLSTWELLASAPAPLPAEEEAALAIGCERCRPITFDHFRMELRDIAPANARSIYLGATLLATRGTRAFLMIGMRGGASVRLDGEEIAVGVSEDRFRRDLVLAPLTIAEGEHRLSIRFDRPEEGAWRGSIRILSARLHPGPGHLAIALAPIDEARQIELAAASVRVDESRALSEGVPVARLRAWIPGGAIARAIPIRVGDREESFAPDAGVHAGELTVAVPLPERGPLAIEASSGERTFELGLNLHSDRRALLAAAELRALRETAPENARAPIAWRERELLRAVRERDADQTWRSLLAADGRRIARSLERGRNPFDAPRGYQRMAFFSRLDDTAQLYELFVPPGYRPGAERRWPLVVTLHGFKGNAGDYFRNTFGLARMWEDGESLVQHGRHGPAPTTGPMFVIGPTGRGQSFYRHMGEVDVLEAIEDVRARFAIDPDRIYITGGSMGGTGAAYLPYRHPDLFAASAALAGYHDQRVREDTDHAALSEAERFLQAHRSDVDWAENGLHLPMLLVRGTRDRPLEWTRCLVRRLETLGYACEHREPDLGHNVWTDTYANGAIFQYFARYRRPSAPAHVRLRTARERTARSFWVSVDQRERADAFADVDARVENGNVIASIEGARAVTFSPPPPLVAEGARFAVRIGERSIEGTSPLRIERGENGWQLATRRYPQPGARTATTGGPIREIFHEPLVFVVGTHDPDHDLINRMVARHWSHPHGVDVEYPIVADTEVTDEMIRSKSLVLIGPPSSNSVLARIADRLPIRVSDDAIAVGDRIHRGEEVGTAFIAPNPLAPDRPVLVIAGPRPLGTWRSIALPDVLPDYVVYDERVAPARDRWACGGTGCEYRAHGFFDMFWRLPD